MWRFYTGDDSPGIRMYVPVEGGCESGVGVCVGEGGCESSVGVGEGGCESGVGVGVGERGCESGVGGCRRGRV